MPTVVWALVGLLGLASILLSLGQRELFARPAADSFAPSGTSALAELLKRDHSVAVDRRPRPQLSSNDVAVAFTSVEPNPTSEEDFATIQESLREYAENGGRVLLLCIPSRFQDASRTLLRAEPVEVVDEGRHRRFRVHANLNLVGSVGVDILQRGDPSVSLWSAEEGDFLRASRVGKGTVVVVTDATAFTNRFLDRADDAAAAVATFGLIAPRGSRLVFTEAAFGNVHQPGLMETLGAWAVAGWYQLLFFVLVVIYTLGRRFGLAEVERTPQRGTRELLDALADTYYRGRHSRIALRTALSAVDVEVRSALRMPRDEELSARDERLSPELRRALAEAYGALTLDQLHPSDTLGIVQRLHQAKQDFLGSRTSRGRRQ
jgi:hypothetical protein